MTIEEHSSEAAAEGLDVTLVGQSRVFVEQLAAQTDRQPVDIVIEALQLRRMTFQVAALGGVVESRIGRTITEYVLDESGAPQSEV